MNKNITVEELKEQAKILRKTAITMIYEAQSGHPGGALSIADIVTCLYFREMTVDPKNPRWPDRDRFVLSKGHVCPIQYSALGILGFFPKSEMYTLRREGTKLQGHPSMTRCPGIDISTGSLGQGLSCAVGMAIAGKRDHKNYMVYAIVGDGEADEGQIWEAVMCAYRYHLDNLVIIIDNNGLQLDGTTDEIMPLLDLTKKFDAFGYDTYDIDGHNMQQIMDTFDKIHAAKNGKPKFINAHTVKGKGVSYMENQLAWHGAAPNEEQYKQAMREIEEGF